MADAKMRTLTINGKKFVIDDADAVQLSKSDGSPPAAGTVPQADGAGGSTWAETVYWVTATPGEDIVGECAVDRTVEEVWTAIADGKTVMAKIVIGGKEGVLTNIITLQPAQAMQYFNGTLTSILFTSTPSAEMAVTLTLTRNAMEGSTPTEAAEINQLEAAVVPNKGIDGQVLTKTTDGYNWQDAPETYPEGGTTGQLLEKTANGYGWTDAPDGVPAGGTTGQVLTKTDSGYAWADPVTVTSAEGVLF